MIAHCGMGGSQGQVSVPAQVQKFYKDVRQRQKLEQGQWRAEGMDSTSLPLYTSVIIPGLLATLRGYQSRALAWMLQKECGADRGGEESHERRCKLHGLWRKLPVSCRMATQQLYFNPYTARLKTVRLHVSCMRT